MGSLLAKAFIAPDKLLGCENVGGLEPENELWECTPDSEDWGWGMVQVLTLMAGYGYILFSASNMLADGSELLLLVPSLAGIVGSIVLPILGAVPDGAIMLFSGLGDDAQEKLTVGIGTLAGSTIMLLTLPWGASIFYGAVPLGSDGAAQYSRRREEGGGLRDRGVTPNDTIRQNAYVMVATALIYLVIQGPAFAYSTDTSDAALEAVGHAEHWYALVGLVVSVVAFCLYLLLMMRQSSSETNEYLINATALKAIQEKGSLTLAGVIAPIIADCVDRAAAAGAKGSQNVLEKALLDNEGKRKLHALLKPFFKKYDANGDGEISTTELILLLDDVGERGITQLEAQHWMEKLDPNRSGAIGTDHLADAMLRYIAEKVKEQSTRDDEPPTPVAKPDEPRKGFKSHPGSYAPPAAGGVAPAAAAAAEEEDEEEEEEEEMPEEFKALTPKQQQVMIKKKACLLMGAGTFLVLTFSDPMVDVMSNMGERLGVPAFYIAFILAPLASNASELLASLSYASKKTKKTITVSLSSLEGAACMNNTFCLGIFMALIYAKGLVWKFTAETLAILVVELCVACIAIKPTQTLAHAVAALSLFPLSIVFVAGLEALGYD